MKIKIAHLLHYYWDGPAIGFRIVHKKRCIGTVCRIPQWLSRALGYMGRFVTFNGHAYGPKSGG